MDTLHEAIEKMTLKALAKRYEDEPDPTKKLRHQHSLYRATQKYLMNKGKTK